MITWRFGAILGAGAMALGLVGGTIAAAQALDESMKPQSGKYSVSMTMVSADLPSLPPDMINVIKQTFEETRTICLTDKEAREGFRDAMRKTQDGDCSFDRFSASGGTIDAKMTCMTQDDPMVMTIKGTGTKTSSDVMMQMSGNMGPEPGSISMRVVRKRIGDC